MSRLTQGITSTAKASLSAMQKGWHAYSDHRQKITAAKATPTVIDAGVFHLADIESEAMTPDDRIKSAFSATIGLVGPFVLALTLSLSNGYFFSGFHDPAWTLPIMLAYIVGAALEFIGLSAIFKAQQALKNGTRKYFVSAFVFALALASISVIAQYLYLQVQFLHGVLTVPDSAINHIPIVSWVIGINGMQGHDWLFFIRASALHLAEIGCTFIISKRQPSLRRMIAQQREIQEARLMWERNELLQDVERGLANQLHTMMQHQQQITQAQFDRQLELMTGEHDTSPLSISRFQQNGTGKNG